MKLSQEKIDKIRAYAKVFGIVFGIMSVILYVVFKVLQIWQDDDWFLFAAWMVAGVGLGLMVISFICFAIVFFLDLDSHLARKEQRIGDLESQVQELQAHKERVRELSPLCNLTDEQQTTIENFLRDLPCHKKDNTQINMKEWARFIRALEELNYISPAKSTDQPGLRKWVESLAENLSVPNQSAFNQALRKATKSNIEDALNIIEKLTKST